VHIEFRYESVTMSDHATDYGGGQWSPVTGEPGDRILWFDPNVDYPTDPRHKFEKVTNRKFKFDTVIA
jgi:hypothetical protein